MRFLLFSTMLVWWLASCGLKNPTASGPIAGPIAQQEAANHQEELTAEQKFLGQLNTIVEQAKNYLQAKPARNQKDQANQNMQNALRDRLKSISTYLQDKQDVLRQQSQDLQDAAQALDRQAQQFMEQMTLLNFANNQKCEASFVKLLNNSSFLTAPHFATESFVANVNNLNASYLDVITHCYETAVLQEAIEKIELINASNLTFNENCQGLQKRLTEIQEDVSDLLVNQRVLTSEKLALLEYFVKTLNEIATTCQGQTAGQDNEAPPANN